MRDQKRIITKQRRHGKQGSTQEITKTSPRARTTWYIKRRITRSKQENLSENGRSCRIVILYNINNSGIL